MELILDVALIALARKVIVLDYYSTDYRTLLAIAGMIMALDLTRFLKTYSRKLSDCSSRIPSTEHPPPSRSNLWKENALRIRARCPAPRP